MAKLAPTLALILASAITGTASAQHSENINFVNGNTLWDMCGETTTGKPPPGCIAYIVGVVDGMAAFHGLKPNICMPESATGQEIADIARKYLADNPGSRHYTASSTIAAALLQSLPCPAH